MYKQSAHFSGRCAYSGLDCIGYFKIPRKVYQISGMEDFLDLRNWEHASTLEIFPRGFSMIMPYRISSKKKMSLCFILSGYRYVSILDLIDFKTKGLEVVTISKLALYKRKE